MMEIFIAIPRDREAEDSQAFLMSLVDLLCSKLQSNCRMLLLFSLSLYPFPNLGPCGTNIHTPHITHYTHTHQPFTYALAISNDPVVKKLPASAGNMRALGSIPGLGRSPEGGHGNPFHYSCLENPMDRGAWWATVHRVAESQTWLKWLNARNIVD